MKTGHKKYNFKYIVGVDEAGRGPLAGPVSVSAIVFQSNFYKRHKNSGNSLPEGHDSKKLSEKKREEWYEKIKAMRKRGKCDFSQSFSGAKIIDKKGIVYAVNLAIARCLRRLNLNPQNTLILLDGSLKAPKIYKQRTIIGGDQREKIIALASVVAKVKRDRKMIRFAKEFPKYAFEIHKGYGTREHYRRIKKYGLSPIHRRSYLGARR